MKQLGALLLGARENVKGWRTTLLGVLTCAAGGYMLYTGQKEAGMGLLIPGVLLVLGVKDPKAKGPDPIKKDGAA